MEGKTFAVLVVKYKSDTANKKLLALRSHIVVEHRSTVISDDMLSGKTK
jgi:hypothetical protein